MITPQLPSGAAAIPLPTVEGGFQTIIADPPWKFQTFSKKGLQKSADIHYDTMPIEDIKALPISDLAAKDAVLYLWATSPMLPEAMDTIKAWGFKYVSSICWDKLKQGTGYWARNEHELVLIAKKGKHPAPAPAKRRGSMIRVKGMKHSVKPDDLHEHLDDAFPDDRKLELFARRPYPGFWVWGNEVEVGYCDKPDPAPDDQIDVEEYIESKGAAA